MLRTYVTTRLIPYIGIENRGLLTRKGDLKQSLLEMRREKVLQLMSMSKNAADIGKEIGISQSTIKRDITFLKAKARNNIRTYVQDRLLFEFDKSLALLDLINKMAWDIVNKESEGKDKILGLTLIRDTNSERISMYTHQDLLAQALKIAETNGRTISKPTLEDLKRQAEKELDKRLKVLKAKEKRESTKESQNKGA